MQRFAVGFVLMSFFAVAASAADPPKVKVETVLTGLDNPMAIAFRPGATGSNELLISESGAGQVVRMLTDKPGKPTPVVTGFPVAAAPAPLGFQSARSESRFSIGRHSSSAQAGLRPDTMCWGSMRCPLAITW